MNMDSSAALLPAEKLESISKLRSPSLDTTVCGSMASIEDLSELIVHRHARNDSTSSLSRAVAYLRRGPSSNRSLVLDSVWDEDEEEEEEETHFRVPVSDVFYHSLNGMEDRKSLSLLRHKRAVAPIVVTEGEDLADVFDALDPEGVSFSVVSWVPLAKAHSYPYDVPAFCGSKQ